MSFFYLYEADHPTPPFRDITKPLLLYLWVAFSIMWPAYTNQLTWSKHGHQPIGSWACLSQAPSPPPTLTWSAKPATPHLQSINGSYAPPQMSTWQHILSSPHLTDIFSHLLYSCLTSSNHLAKSPRKLRPADQHSASLHHN